MVAVLGHVDDNVGEIGDVGEHDRVGDKVHVLELFLLFDGIAALDDGPAEGDPVQEIVEGLDLGGFGTNTATHLGDGDVAEQEQGARDPPEFTKGPPIEQMTIGEMEDLIHYHGSVAAGRYDELKDRARTSEEIRRSKERATLIDAMSAAELNAYLASLACLRPSEIGR